MANLQSASISYSETNLAGTGDVEVSITYTLEVTPMEKLLSNYGFYFREYISLFEVNQSPDVLGENDPEDENDEFLFWLPGASIPSDEIASSPSNTITRTRTELVERHLLRGSDSTPDAERIRARVTIGVSSVDAAEVSVPGSIFSSNFFTIDPFPVDIGNGG